MKFAALFLLFLVILTISITFGANNDQIVVFNYLIGQREYRLSTLLALLLGFGFLIGWFLTAIFYVAVKLKLNRTQRKLKKIEKLYEHALADHRKQQLIADGITFPKKK